MALNGHDTAASPDPPRDPAIDRAYAAGATEGPPVLLDAAILAAARREVGARPRRLDSVLRAWRAPVALAAVLVLSVTVVLLMREEGADRLADALPPTAAPSSPADSAPPAEEARTANDARTAQPEAPRAKAEAESRASPGREAVSRLRNAPAAPALPEQDRSVREQAAPEVRQEAPRVLEAHRPAPRPFAEAPTVLSEAGRGPPETPPPQTDALAKQAEPGAGAQGRAKERAEGEQQVARQRAAEGGARMEQRDDAGVGSRPVWQGYDTQPPGRWLERVDELFRAGRDAEAREMLVEFRKRFPQHPVPPALNR